MISGKCGIRVRRWGWITVSQIVLGPTDGQKPLVLQWQFKALGNTNILPWVRSVCYTLHHSFTVLSDHLLLSMVALPVRGRSRFPSPNHTELLSLLSFLLSKPKTLLVSPDMWMIQGSSGGGKLGNVCVVGMFSRTFSKTNVRFDTNNCRG